MPSGILTITGHIESFVPGHSLNLSPMPPVPVTVTTSPMQNFPGHVPFPDKLTVLVLAVALVVNF